MVIFYAFLNIADINSKIIYEENTDNKMIRRDYLKQLYSHLVHPHLVSRLQLPNLSLALRSIIIKTGKIKPKKNPQFAERRLCYHCPRRANSYTTKNCTSCNAPICNKHMIRYCCDCQSNLVSREDL